MGAREAVAAAALGLFGLFALAQSARLDPGTATRPGPGFYPLILSVGLCLVAAILLIQARRGPEAPTPAAGPAPARAQRLVPALAALAAYVAIFEPAGFVVATVALLTFFFRVLGRYPWPLALGGAVAGALVATLVFDVWLGVRLPPGSWRR